MDYFNKNKSWIILNLPALAILCFILLQSEHNKILISYIGYIALSLLTVLLCLNPLVMMFPKVTFFKKINRYRRIIGITVFIYSFVHLISLLLYIGLKKSYAVFIHPVMLPGFIAWLIFIPLCITSNNFFIKKMSYPKWKTLHRKVYLAEWLIFFHILIQSTKSLSYGLFFFIPLFILQLLRIKKQKQINKEINLSKTN